MKYIDVYVGDLRSDDALDWIFAIFFLWAAYALGGWVGIVLLLFFFFLRIKGR